MLLGTEVLPLRLHLLVGFKFGVCLAILKAHLLIDRYEVGEEQGVDAFVLVFRLHGHEEQVEDLRFAPKQRPEQVEPSPRKQAPLGFLQSARQAGH